MTNLDDLMAVWKSQDKAPLHGVNDTLLRLALRKDDASMVAERRVALRITYGVSVVQVAVIAFAFWVIIYPNGMLSGWDYAIPIAGVAAPVFWAVAVHVIYREQTRREQSFGESLRDQINRHIVQLDMKTFPSLFLVHVLPMTVWGVAVFFGFMRINEKSLGDSWGMLAGMLLYMVIVFALSFRFVRRREKQRWQPRRRRLEALLKELDGQE